MLKLSQELETVQFKPLPGRPRGTAPCMSALSSLCLCWGELLRLCPQCPTGVPFLDPGAEKTIQIKARTLKPVLFIPASLCLLWAGCWLFSDEWNGKYPSHNLKFKQNCFLGISVCVCFNSNKVLRGGGDSDPTPRL